jgi:hypothetical protein
MPACGPRRHWTDVFTVTLESNSITIRLVR